jgi:hypothetical protein
MLKNPQKAEAYIEQKLETLKQSGYLDWLLAEFSRESQTDPALAYPSQGLVRTPYDGDAINQAHTDIIPQQEFIDSILPGMLYYLELFNHPQRIARLLATPIFTAPQKHALNIFSKAKTTRQAISINQLALSPQGHTQPRVSRSEKFQAGPFVSLGNQPRSLLVGSANPEVWGSAPAIAHMAQTHSLIGIPRDGFFSNIQRQADLATSVLTWLEKSPLLVDRPAEQAEQLLTLWKHNVMGVLEVSPKKGLARAEALYQVGIRTFRLYSPEPGSDLVKMVKLLRKLEKQNNWEPIEIFAGQVVDTDQAVQAAKAGATGLYVGIGGGGRCKTGVRGGLAIDWPELIWSLRGAVAIPVIIEGGASDAIAQTLAVGGTGIGVTRIAAGGTVESPGGLRYFVNSDGRFFKPYGGEASGRVKYLGGKAGPYGIIPYEEGEVGLAFRQYGRGNLPTLLSQMYYLNGDVILAFVMQNTSDLASFQQKAVKTLQTTSALEVALRQPHT